MSVKEACPLELVKVGTSPLVVYYTLLIQRCVEKSQLLYIWVWIVIQFVLFDAERPTISHGCRRYWVVHLDAAVMRHIIILALFLSRGQDPERKKLRTFQAKSPMGIHVVYAGLASGMPPKKNSSRPWETTRAVALRHYPSSVLSTVKSLARLLPGWTKRSDVPGSLERFCGYEVIVGQCKR